VVNWVALRGIRGGAPRGADAYGGDDAEGFRSLLRARSVPLYGVAFSFGVTSSVFLSFAVDHATDVGALGGPGSSGFGPTMFLALGAAGSLGLFAGEFEHRFGLRRLLMCIFICSFASLMLLGLAPGSWGAVLASAALQGAFIMTISAVLAFWSLRVFPFIPSLSFTAVLLIVATGNVAGPALAGLAAVHFGMGPTFLAAGGLSLLTALAMPLGVQGKESGS
jgi:predicted MFS family arabinose efflux permease